jgi:protein-S-isoprenylcysteine O-methyltransferase Ste14
MRRLVQLIGYVGIQAGLLFVSAGRLDWPMAWLCLAVHLLFGTFLIVRGNPQMLRARSAQEAAAKPWDVLLATLAAALFGPAPLVVAGLDVGRFHWSPPMPPWVQMVALLVFALGMGLGGWAMVTNKFFTKYVHIQQAAGHYAVDRGPYAIVRHPGYSSAALAFGTLPIALGSLWALVPAWLGISLLVVRTYLEDETLKAELPGYGSYAGRIRWRLFPGIW